MMYPIPKGCELVDCNNDRNQILFVRNLCVNCRNFTANPVNARLDCLSEYCKKGKMKEFMALVRSWNNEVYDAKEEFNFEPKCFVAKVKKNNLGQVR